MKKSINDKCPCGSGLKYKKCCGLFHKGKVPSNALDLMKSRYSAYAYNNTNYIIQTTHKENPEYTQDIIGWEQDIESFCDATHFISLCVNDFIDGEDEAYVTFKACLKQHGEDVSFREKSRFLKVDGRWLYHSGEIIKREEDRDRVE